MGFTEIIDTQGRYVSHVHQPGFISISHPLVLIYFDISKFIQCKFLRSFICLLCINVLILVLYSYIQIGFSVINHTTKKRNLVLDPIWLVEKLSQYTICPISCGDLDKPKHSLRYKKRYEAIRTNSLTAITMVIEMPTESTKSQ